MAQKRNQDFMGKYPYIGAGTLGTGTDGEEKRIFEARDGGLSLPLSNTLSLSLSLNVLITSPPLWTYGQTEL